MPTQTQIKNFQDKIRILQQLRRTGWVIRHVPAAETVADHSWRMAVMALQRQDELKTYGVNTEHLIEMCLLHDVGESVIGDIIPEKEQEKYGTAIAHKISELTKKQLEETAINTLSKQCHFPKIKTVFDEYEAQTTLEAKVAKNLDKLDMLLQAYEYIQTCPQAETENLHQFMPNNEKGVNLPFFLADLQEIKNRQYQQISAPNSFIDFQLIAGKVKHLTEKGMPTSETSADKSIASVSFQMALTALHLELQLTQNGYDLSQLLPQILLYPIGKVLGDSAPAVAKQFNLPLLETCVQTVEATQSPLTTLIKEPAHHLLATSVPAQAKSDNRVHN